MYIFNKYTQIVASSFCLDAICSLVESLTIVVSLIFLHDI